MKNFGGRCRKHSKEQERNLAIGFLSAKRREPWLTQEVYARNYGVSARTLRRYIREHTPLEEIESKLEALKLKESEILQKIKDTPVQDDVEKNERGGLVVAWT